MKCSSFGKCGSCVLWEIPYEEQLKIKEKRTRFERIVYLTKTKDLEKQETLMRKELQINKYKEELRKLRKK